MLEKYLGEIQQEKKRRRIEEKGFSEERKSEEIGKEIGRNEIQHKRPLTMELGRLARWGSGDKTIFNDLMVEFRRGDLNLMFPNDIFTANGRVNYCKEEFWRTLAELYNIRALNAGVPTREPYELILWGEKIKGDFSKQRCHGKIKDALDQIFSPCANCQRIPIFPVSLLETLGFHRRSDSRSRSRSRSASASERAISEAGFASVGSGARTCSGYHTAEILDTESGQVVGLLCDMLEKELISEDDVSALLNQADKWFKDRGSWRSFVLNTDIPLERKAKVMKSALRSLGSV